MPTNQMTGQPDLKPYMVQLLPGEDLLAARARWERETGWTGPILVHF
ncbi:hypothetical protein [Novosphingobium sp.]